MILQVHNPICQPAIFSSFFAEQPKRSFSLRSRPWCGFVAWDPRRQNLEGKLPCSQVFSELSMDGLQGKSKKQKKNAHRNLTGGFEPPTHLKNMRSRQIGFHFPQVGIGVKITTMIENTTWMFLGCLLGTSARPSSLLEIIKIYTDTSSICWK